MGEVIEFRTKRQSERPSENSRDRQNRAFWKGPPDDTAPSEYQAPSEDSA
jgi:hypothetical protein